MTDADRQALQDEHAACLARAAAIVVALTGTSSPGKPAVASDAYVTLKTAAAAWGIHDDSARKKLRRLADEHPEWVTKRGAGRWWVHREALR